MAQRRELDPSERLLAAMVRLAIKDATKGKNERLRAEVRDWLWWVAPLLVNLFVQMFLSIG